MLSFRPLGLRLPRALARAGLVALGLTLVAGCSDQSALEQAGATLSGRIRLAPLREAPPAGRETVQMLPFSGIPVTIGDAIYRSFRTEAAAANIDLVHRLEDPATWRIQGHFVALGHSTSSTILYTYDIYDASGTPVHRIVGQDVAGGADGDPWGAVDGDVQARLAKRSARDIQAWLNRSRR